MTTFSNSTLSANNLKAIRGLRTLFQDISFELSSGSALRIEGSNGAGKTTLLRMITGLGFIAEGEVLWNQQAINQVRSEYNHSLHYLGHQLGLKLALTPNENLLFLQSFFGLKRDQEAIDRTLDYFEIKNKQHIPCHALSAGQKQRITLAKLKLIPKPLWVLDEPLTSLDKDIVLKLVSLMQSHLSENGLIIFTSHQELREQSFEYQSLFINKQVKS